MEMDFPALAIYQDVSFMDQVTFRGAYPFYVRLDIIDFVGYMDFYAYSVDKLLYQNPFFSKQ
jgi:hypothetical protein